MTPDQPENDLRMRLALTFSAELCPHVPALADLDPTADRVPAADGGNAVWEPGHRDHLPVEQLLADAELVIDGADDLRCSGVVRHAAGTRQISAQAEVIFEYRSSEASGPAQQREEYRRGFFLFSG